MHYCMSMSQHLVYVCTVHVYLEFHVSIRLLRTELHLFLELLQCHICLLDLLPLALPGSVQLALHFPLNQTHTEISICRYRNAIADQESRNTLLRNRVELIFIEPL